MVPPVLLVLCSSLSWYFSSRTPALSLPGPFLQKTEGLKKPDIRANSSNLKKHLWTSCPLVMVV